MLILIKASELQVGDTIVDDRNRKQTVFAVERGEHCRGIHVNVVRRDTRVLKDKQGKAVGLNPDRGAMTHNDGCYAACSPLVVQRNG